jgi:hypothetical protein
LVVNSHEIRVIEDIPPGKREGLIREEDQYNNKWQLHKLSPAGTVDNNLTYSR